MRRAIAAGQLRLHYQPVVDCATGRIDHLEALVRWQHPTLGLIGPDRFIPLAERAGIVAPLTCWVLEEAIAQCRRWRQAGRHLGIAVNIPAPVLEDPCFPALIEVLLACHPIDTALLTLELTESAAFQDPEHAASAMRRLAAMGLRLSLDDFGTGHSTAERLTSLPFDELKVDRSLLASAHDAPGRATLLGILHLARARGARAVVEGVECAEQWLWLCAAGCQSVQGYYVSRPLPVADLECWLADRASVAA